MVDMKEQLMEKYRDLKASMNLDSFESGVIVGFFIYAILRHKQHKRFRRDISKALEQTVINVRRVN